MNVFRLRSGVRWVGERGMESGTYASISCLRTLRMAPGPLPSYCQKASVHRTLNSFMQICIWNFDYRHFFCRFEAGP